MLGKRGLIAQKVYHGLEFELFRRWDTPLLQLRDGQRYFSFRCMRLRRDIYHGNMVVMERHR